MARVDRTSLSVLLALALLGGGLSFIVGGQPQARADTVPDGLFADLTDLNKKLGNLIQDERKGDGLDFHDLLRRIKEIKTLKQEMVDEFFVTEIYGVKFNEVFKKLDCVDSWLYYGWGASFPGSDASNDHITGRFETAKKCKEQLEEKFYAANASPSPSPSTSPATTGSPSASASPSPSWTLGFSGTWYHYGPGESALFGCVTTNPAQGGAPYNYALTKPDNSMSSKSGNLDTSGKATISTPINQYGTYKQTVSVTSGGVTQEKTTETNVTSSQGQSGCP